MLFSKIEDIIFKRNQLTLWSEVALKEILNQKTLKVKPFDIEGKFWFEIDDHEDLKKAEKRFSTEI